MKILIVDDAALMRTVLRRIFESAGFNEIVEAADGEEAVRLYRRETPDLVTMDITMPEMNGLVAIQKIIALNPRANIIVCSALGQKEIVLDAIKSGAKHFLVKPFEAEKVIATAKAVMKIA